MSKKCRNCGNEIPEEASFCMQCFTKISPTSDLSEISNAKIAKKNKKILPFIAAAIVILLIPVSLLSAKAFSDTEELNTQSAQPSKPNVSDKTEPQSTVAVAVTAQTVKEAEESKETAKSKTEKTEKTTKKKEKAKKEETSSKKENTSTASQKDTQASSAESEAPEGKLNYEDYGDGLIITSYSGSEREIIIPDKVNGKSVIAVGKKAFSSNKNIKSIVFEEGSSPKTLKISKNAFYNLPKLTKIKLTSITEADNFTSCVAKCAALENIVISKKFDGGEYYSSNGVIYRKSNENTVLMLYPSGKDDSSFSIPYAVTEINKNAFKGNKYLKKIKFSKREIISVDWDNMFSKKNIKNLNAVEVYPGTNADTDGIQHTDKKTEIIYYG